MTFCRSLCCTPLGSRESYIASFNGVLAVYCNKSVLAGDYLIPSLLRMSAGFASACAHHQRLHDLYLSHFFGVNLKHRVALPLSLHLSKYQSPCSKYGSHCLAYRIKADSNNDFRTTSHQKFDKCINRMPETILL